MVPFSLRSSFLSSDFSADLARTHIQKTAKKNKVALRNIFELLRRFNLGKYQSEICSYHHSLRIYTLKMVSPLPYHTCNYLFFEYFQKNSAHFPRENYLECNYKNKLQQLLRNDQNTKMINKLLENLK